MTSNVQFELPPLGYAYDALEPAYSAELLELHYAAHHKAYVDGANQTLAALVEARSRRDFARINQLERDLAFHLSGHVMHSIFWRNLEPNGGAPPSGRLEACIDSSFGSLDSLRRQMAAAGTSLQGSGWVSLAWESTRGTLLVQQVYDHQDNTGSATLPLLVMDMWEHAYYLQYRNRKDRWISVFWDLINWGDVRRRFENAECADLALDIAVPGQKRAKTTVTPIRRKR
jgi:Fe-Mn family superoxide dismutase